MSPEMKQPNVKRPDRAEELAHERARLLSAESVDAQLDPTDHAWLADHLGTCADCAAIDEEYRAIHDELRNLPAPEPPRDLWARTSAALDTVDAAASRKAPGGSRTAGFGRRPLFSTAIAVGFVVVIAAVSIMNQGPLRSLGSGPTGSSMVALGSTTSGRSPSAPQGPLAVVDGTKYWISSNAGVYEIKGSSATCVATDGSCSVPGGNGQTLGSIASTSQVSAAIAPDATRAAVWSKDKVAIVPLSSMPTTVSLDQLTPRPTTSAQAQTPTPASTPVETQGASLAPTAVPTAAAAGPALAILSGYEIVGRDPEFSADGTLLAFAARPIDHSTGPEVYLWRVGEDRAEAVTSRSEDLFAGWYGRRILISEISAATASGGADTSAISSYVFDPETDTALQFDVPMLLPTVDPTGQFLIYWSGAVEFDPESGLWRPGTGDLYFDTWSDLRLTPVSLEPIATPTDTPVSASSPSPDSGLVTPPPTPTPTPTSGDTQTTAPDAAGSPGTPDQAALPQVLPVTTGPNLVQTWVVRWDAAGLHVAIWVAQPGSSKIGRLSLFSVDRASGRVDTNEPLLAADKVMSSIAFDGDHLVYTSAVDAKTYIQTIPAVPPSTVSTPEPTTPGQLPSDASPNPSN